MSGDLSHKAAKGAIWATIDRFGSMVIQFVVNLVLARLLLPVDFGIIGMLTIFIVVSQTLIDGGFASALIQKKVPTEADYSTIFYWNICFSLAIYIILYVCAPWIADFYRMPLLTKVLRILALMLIINSVLSIQRTRLQKTLAFKILAIVNIGSYILGSMVGIVLAYKGYGVWSLVMFQIVYGCIAVILMSIITKWHPRLEFSLRSLKKLFGFGGYIMAANILQTISQNLQGIVIGRRFSAIEMGYFSQSYKLDQVVSKSIPQVLVQVMYPIYSQIQEDRDYLNNVVCMNLRVVSFIVYPLLGILILIAHPLIEFLYGIKWLPSAPLFQVLCVGGFFICLQNLNFYAVAAVGKSKTLFMWSFYKWGFLLSAICIGMFLGIYGILWGMVLSEANIFFVNAYLASKHTGLAINRQLKNIMPIIGIEGISLGGAYLVGFWWHNMIMETIVFIGIYTYVALRFRIRALQETVGLVIHLRHHREN